MIKEFVIALSVTSLCADIPPMFISQANAEVDGEGSRGIRAKRKQVRGLDRVQKKQIRQANKQANRRMKRSLGRQEQQTNQVRITRTRTQLSKSQSLQEKATISPHVQLSSPPHSNQIFEEIHHVKGTLHILTHELHHELNGINQRLSHLATDVEGEFNHVRNIVSEGLEYVIEQFINPQGGIEEPDDNISIQSREDQMIGETSQIPFQLPYLQYLDPQEFQIAIENIAKDLTKAQNTIESVEELIESFTPTATVISDFEDSKMRKEMIQGKVSLQQKVIRELEEVIGLLAFLRNELPQVSMQEQERDVYVEVIESSHQTAYDLQMRAAQALASIYGLTEYIKTPRNELPQEDTPEFHGNHLEKALSDMSIDLEILTNDLANKKESVEKLSQRENEIRTKVYVYIKYLDIHKEKIETGIRVACLAALEEVMQGLKKLNNSMAAAKWSPRIMSTPGSGETTPLTTPRTPQDKGRTSPPHLLTPKTPRDLKTVKTPRHIVSPRPVPTLLLSPKTLTGEDTPKIVITPLDFSKVTRTTSIPSGLGRNSSPKKVPTHDEIKLVVEKVFNNKDKIYKLSSDFEVTRVNFNAAASTLIKTFGKFKSYEKSPRDNMNKNLSILQEIFDSPEYINKYQPLYEERKQNITTQTNELLSLGKQLLNAINTEEKK